jgi:hypothetical protein
MKKYWLHPKYCWYNFCYLKVFNKHLNNVYLATLVFKTLYRPKHAEIGSICANQGGLQQNLVEEGRRFVTKTPMCGNLKCKVIDLGWFILLSHNWSMYSIIIKLSGLQIANYDGVGIIVQLTILFMLIDIRNSGTRLSHWYWKLYRTTIVLHADRTPSHVQPDMPGCGSTHMAETRLESGCVPVANSGCRAGTTTRTSLATSGGGWWLSSI